MVPWSVRAMTGMADGTRRLSVTWQCCSCGQRARTESTPSVIWLVITGAMP